MGIYQLIAMAKIARLFVAMEIRFFCLFYICHILKNTLHFQVELECEGGALNAVTEDGETTLTCGDKPEFSFG
jgi:hypothetical protein